MKKTGPLIAALVCLLSISSCATFQGLLKQPTITFEKVSMQEMSLFQGTAVFTFRIENPLPLSLQLEHLQYNLQINGRELAKGTLHKGITLKSREIRPVDLPVVVRFSDLFASLSEFMEKDTIPYALSGSCGFGMFTVPFQKSGTFTVPTIPDISIQGMTVRELSFSGATLLFRLDIVNQNDFSLVLDGLDYQITLGDIDLVSGKTEKIPDLSEKGHSTIALPVNINFLALGRAAYRLLSEPETHYAIQGFMKVAAPEGEEKRFPFSNSGTLQIQK